MTRATYGDQPQCGCYTLLATGHRRFLPVVDVAAHTTILSTTSTTTLTQDFVNPDKENAQSKVRYRFPLYDGVSVVGFEFTVGRRTVTGVVKEKEEAAKDFEDAVQRGETAALLEQSEDASDVFVTTIGNVPAGETIKVQITYLGELHHDAEIDGIRFTLPTHIAPRYGTEHLVAGAGTADSAANSISVTVDVDMAGCSAIKQIQSPSHPIAVSIGSMSTAASDAPSSPQKASASLTIPDSTLDRDFVIQVIVDGLLEPAAVLETHPTLPNRRALMATLVPRFDSPSERPELVFICDRSGSMDDFQKMPNLITALHLFLRSLPIGVTFNICSFGTKCTFLWPTSQPYSQKTLDVATAHVSTFAADYGGTEMMPPVKESIARRDKSRNLDMFLLTDGEIWQQGELVKFINENVAESKHAIRAFTLGIGRDVSHALIAGVARAGRGFSQSVGENERMEKKVVRMLKAALTPHVSDYSLEIKYDKSAEATSNDDEDDFEIVEKVMDGLTIVAKETAGSHAEAGEEQPAGIQPPRSLFDATLKNEDLDKIESTSAHSPLVHVPTPSYLQAPTDIPALFSFNRTTVYVLLSDATPLKSPKSVILRATSTQGPLHLEIPITVLEEKGTTIHKLAARKAIGEIEEFRGWLSNARTTGGDLLINGSGSQSLAINKREAVRLGVEYQVASRWTSFVAVQTKGDKDLDSESVRHSEDTKVGIDSSSRVDAMAADANPYGLFEMPIMANIYDPTICDDSIMITDHLEHASMHARYRKRKASVPILGGLASVVGGIGSSVADKSARVGSKIMRAAPKAIFGSRSVPESAPLPPPPPPSAPAPALKMALCSAASVSLPGAGQPGASPATEPASAEDGAQTQLAVLASLQSFIGSWAWSRELEGLLGIAEAEASQINFPTKFHDTSILATLCAVAYLREMMPDEEEAWELLAEKAESWLAEQVASTGIQVTKLEDTARDHLRQRAVDRSA